MPHTHRAHEKDPQPDIYSTKYHKLSKACNHERYWRICKDTDCKKLVDAHDAAVLAHHNDKAIAALRAAAERIQREEDDKRRMPAPKLPHHRQHTHTHMTHLLGQLKILSGPNSVLSVS
jgi:hypothetical protein